ncbi:hypothetical protein B0H13DRAFT_2320825 [Mycena leptocephala]|nr:hypothetical protein B0H13DRAFT_2320825 [Mycena leptocephala]
MPPKTSSASSGTRKKHACKAQAAHGVKPGPSRRRPGLRCAPPAALLVVLRSLGKDAPVVKIRALEEFNMRAGWRQPVSTYLRAFLRCLQLITSSDDTLEQVLTRFNVLGMFSKRQLVYLWLCDSCAVWGEYAEDIFLPHMKVL